MHPKLEYVHEYSSKVTQISKKFDFYQRIRYFRAIQFYGHSSMIGSLIQFDAPLQSTHQEMMSLFSTTFGGQKVPNATGIEQSYIGKSCSDLAREIHATAGNSLFFSPDKLQEMLQNLKKISKKDLRIPNELTHAKAFHLGLMARYKKIITLSSYLIIALKLDYSGLHSHPKVFHQCAGYLTLLTVVLHYNCAVLARSCDKSNVSMWLNNALDMVALFESTHFPELDEGFFLQMRQLLAQRIVDFQRSQLALERALPQSQDKSLSLSELKHQVDKKNERAIRFGSPYHAEVFHYKDAVMLHDVDLNAMGEFLACVKSAAEKEHPTQFLFYCNQDLGPIELLNVYFNQETKQLELINISCGNSFGQHNFLNYLLQYLKAQDVKFKLLACQANLQPDPSCNALYALAFSAILANASFSRLEQKKFQVVQPKFSDPRMSMYDELPTYPEVQWFDVVALGDKAILMAPSYEAILRMFKRLYGAKEGDQRLKFYLRKYDLSQSGAFANKHQFFYQHYHAKLSKPQGDSRLDDLSLMEITSRVNEDAVDDLALAEMLSTLSISHTKSKRRLKPKKVPLDYFKDTNCALRPDGAQKVYQYDAKALRRGAADYCRLVEFEYMLSQLSAQHLNEFDEKRQYTPLMLALKFDKPKQALLLCEQDANTKLENAQGETPASLYAKLPKDSLVKRNSELKKFFV